MEITGACTHTHACERNRWKLIQRISCGWTSFHPYEGKFMHNAVNNAYKLHANEVHMKWNYMIEHRFIWTDSSKIGPYCLRTVPSETFINWDKSSLRKNFSLGKITFSLLRIFLPLGKVPKIKDFFLSRLSLHVFNVCSVWYLTKGLFRKSHTDQIFIEIG